MKNTRKIVFMGLFIALEIVLTRVIGLMPSNITRVSLSFVVYTFSGLVYGPWYTMCMAGVGDVVGAFLFPPNGGYYFGFTVSAMISGFLFGSFKQNEKVSYYRLAVILLINLLLVEVLFNTFWLQVLTRSYFFPLLVKRIPGIIVNTILRIVVLVPFINKMSDMNFGG